VKLNAFSRRKPATKPQFSRKIDKEKANETEQSSRMHSVGGSRNSVASATDNAPGRERASRREKGELQLLSRHSVGSENEVKATQSIETGETDEDKQKERVQRIRMYSVGNESDIEKEQAEENY
jgi:hypothetical protein